MTRDIVNGETPCSARDFGKLSGDKRRLLEKRLKGAGKKGSGARPHLAAREPGTALPLSFTQERMCFVEHLFPGTAVYNNAAAFMIKGGLDIERLRRSLRVMIGRHEILRTGMRFFPGSIAPVAGIEAAGGDCHSGRLNSGVRDACRTCDSESEQVIYSSVEPVLLEHEARDGEVDDETLAALTRLPFDLEKPPLFRLHCFRTGPGETLLLFVFHHTVMDGWSRRIFFGELARFYIADEAATVDAPRPPPIQYADFTLWQRKLNDTGCFDRQLRYWKRRLDGLNEDPFRERIERLGCPGFDGAHIDFQIDESLKGRLGLLCASSGATLYNALLTGFAVVLGAYTGCSDFAVGVPVAGRTVSLVENSIGPFINTLPRRIRLGEARNLRDLFDSLSACGLSDLSHGEIPVERIAAARRSARSATRNPMFQVLLNMHVSGDMNFAIDGLDIKLRNFETGFSLLDLSLTVREGERKIDLRLEYAVKLIERKEAQDFTDAFIYVLECLAEGREIPLTDLTPKGITEVDPATDRRQASAGRTGAKAAGATNRNTGCTLAQGQVEELLVLGRGEKTDCPLGQSLHRRFEERVAASPDSIAVIDEHGQVDYDTLNRKANLLARALVRENVRPGDRVAVLLPKSTDMVAAFLAVIKAGASYVPLYIREPAASLERKCSDADVRVVIVDSALFAGRVRGFTTLDASLLSSSDGAGVDNLEYDGGGGDCLYVMYTSGSTGRAKGAAIPHRAVMRLVVNPDYVDVTENSVFLSCLPASFDASTFHIWAALLNGGTCVMHNEDIPTVEGLSRAIGKNGITTMFLTTSLFNAVVDEDCSAFRGLDTLLVGGEALSVSHTGKCVRELPGLKILNAYGPTETTTFALCMPLDKGVGDDWKSVPIGRPIAHTNVYIVNEHDELLPRGAAGQLLIGGAGLAIEYVNRPGLTAGRFTRLEIAGQSELVYRSGDICRWREDGLVEFIGRADEQVKISGFRIEPAEIEHRIRACVGVSKAAVVAIGDDVSKRCLYAFVEHSVPGMVSCNGKDRVDGTEAGTASKVNAEAERIRGLLARELPPYMVPSRIVFLEAIPVTRNGKTDKAALAAWVNEHKLYGRRVLRPRTQMEDLLLSLWYYELKTYPISTDDDFFRIGGTSIGAVRIFSQLQKITGCEFPLALLFEAPTIAGLAALLEKREWKASWEPVVTIRDSGEAMPLYFIHPIDGNVVCYVGLARHITPRHPVYGIQARGLDGRSRPHETIEAMTRSYADELTAHRPKGPFCLAGWSSGGIVAIETARLLAERGRPVELLVLIDPLLVPVDTVGAVGAVLEGVVNLGRETVRLLGRRTALHLKRISGLSPGLWPGYIIEKMGFAAREITQRLKAGKDMIRHPASAKLNRLNPPRLPEEYEQAGIIRRLSMAALKKHRPKPVECGRVLCLLRDEEYDERSTFVGKLFGPTVVIRRIRDEHNFLIHEKGAALAAGFINDML